MSGPTLLDIMNKLIKIESEIKKLMKVTKENPVVDEYDESVDYVSLLNVLAQHHNFRVEYDKESTIIDNNVPKHKVYCAINSEEVSSAEGIGKSSGVKNLVAYRAIMIKKQEF